MNRLYLTDGVGTRGTFSTSFALLVSSPNQPQLTHLFPAFLELLYQEPGKPVMLVFAFSDPAEIMSDQYFSWSGKEGTVPVI